MVGVTGSASSAAALRRAVFEARRSGSTLLAVLAWQPPGGEAVYRLAPEPELAALWERQAEQRLDAAIHAALGSLPTDVVIEPLAVRGPVAWALTALADRPDDLVVLGAGPSHPSASVFRGTVPRKVAARSLAPVLLVAPPVSPRFIRRELRRVRPEDFMRPTATSTGRP